MALKDNITLRGHSKQLKRHGPKILTAYGWKLNFGAKILISANIQMKKLRFTIFAEISAHQKQWFFKGRSTQNRWVLMGDFSKGGVHKTDGLLMGDFFKGGSIQNRWALMGDFSKGGVHKTDRVWWMIFQRGEYIKPMDCDGWFFKGESTQNRWVLMGFGILCIASKN